jgi:hypothetical protein
MINELLQQLEPKARRGSKARCHLLTHGSKEEVAQRLTRLIASWGTVDVSDAWMPQGFVNTKEAQLGREDILIDKAIGKTLIDWWLAVPRRARIPNWDIASTCTIEGKKGLLLVEAKAHDEELTVEQAGKRREKTESVNSRRNRAQIGECIGQANQALSAETQMPWSLSIEHNYQTSNRFAWAWKLTELGIPVILVYLGFLKANEMKDRGIPFNDEVNWTNMVISHSSSLFPAQVWNQRWTVNGQAFIPLIRTIELSL